MEDEKALLPVETYEIGIVPMIGGVMLKLCYLPAQPGAPARWTPALGIERREARALAQRLLAAVAQLETALGEPKPTPH